MGKRRRCVIGGRVIGAHTPTTASVCLTRLAVAGATGGTRTDGDATAHAPRGRRAWLEWRVSPNGCKTRGVAQKHVDGIVDGEPE